MEGNAAVGCLYSDFTAHEEQFPAAVLGSVLKHIAGKLNEVSERTVLAFRDRGKFIGREKLALAEIVELLQDISSLRCIFRCIDPLDECPSGHRVELLDSLNHILQKPPGAQIFLTQRSHILGEIGRHLVWRAAAGSIIPTKDDIIIFLREKLKEDTMPDRVDERLKKEIMQNISHTVSDVSRKGTLTNIPPAVC